MFHFRSELREKFFFHNSFNVFELLLDFMIGVVSLFLATILLSNVEITFDCDHSSPVVKLRLHLLFVSEAV